MKISKSRFLFCLAICFAVLFTPFLLGISLDGKAHAMGLLGSSGGNGGNDNISSTGSTGAIITEPAPPVSHAPEPTTLLLFGAGAVGLAAVRKKFGKK
jgi:hypothetical protein